MQLTLADLSLLTMTGIVAGGLGAMLGIGGGLLVIPVLVLGFAVPVHVAVATSLVAVVATSTATGSVYVGRGLTNMRLAMKYSSWAGNNMNMHPYLPPYRPSMHS